MKESTIAKLAVAAVLTCVGIITAMSVLTSAQWEQPSGVPAFNPRHPDSPPPIADPSRFRLDQDKIIYGRAKEVASVLGQIPCYCYCDRSHGHRSLATCFESEHASRCRECKKEAQYVWEQVREGKEVGQIRAEIIEGNWKKVSLEPEH